MRMQNHNPSRIRTSPLMQVFLGAVATMSIAASVQAQEARPGPYVGATIGKPDFKADSIGGISGDSAGSAYKIYGGYRFSPYWGAELSAVRLGRLSGALGDAKSAGYGLDAVGMLPLSNNWTALGRLGVANIKTSALGADDRSSAPKIGLGMQYNLNTNTALRGEWERYRIDAFGAKSSVDTFSLGAQVAF